MVYPFSNAFDVDSFEARLRDLARREPFLFPESDIPDHYRHSSVLICFWRERSDLRVVLTKRAATLSGHPGQMSFPGGKLESGESWAAAAIRETEEETGIPRQEIEVLGRFDDAWSGAGHLLAPIVGWLDAAPTFAPNPAEVAEMHTPSIMQLMSPAAYSEEEANVGDHTFINPILSWQNGRLFGLSTGLLIEALQWASGIDLQHGRSRLESLRSYLEIKESQNEADSTA